MPCLWLTGLGYPGNYGQGQYQQGYPQQQTSPPQQGYPRQQTSPPQCQQQQGYPLQYQHGHRTQSTPMPGNSFNLHADQAPHYPFVASDQSYTGHGQPQQYTGTLPIPIPLPPNSQQTSPYGGTTYGFGQSPSQTPMTPLPSYGPPPPTYSAAVGSAP